VGILRILWCFGGVCWYFVVVLKSVVFGVGIIQNFADLVDMWWFVVIVVFVLVFGFACLFCFLCVLGFLFLNFGCFVGCISVFLEFVVFLGWRVVEVALVSWR